MAVTLGPGDAAPDFEAKDQDGKMVCLKDFKGRRLVLYFYPEDDTPTCTVQACNLRDNFETLKAEGFTIVGVSPNDAQSHQKFQQKFSLPFTLLADPEHKLIEAYGVWGEKNLYGRKYMGLHRTTFVIDANGIIEKVIRRPKSKTHAQEILR